MNFVIKLLLLAAALLPLQIFATALSNTDYKSMVGQYRLIRGSNVCPSEVDFVGLPSCFGFEIEGLSGPFCNINGGKYSVTRSENGVDFSYESISKNSGLILDKKEAVTASFVESKSYTDQLILSLSKKRFTFSRQEKGKSHLCIYQLIMITE